MAGNEITLVGNVTREPELKFTPSGKAVVNFGIAADNRRRNADGTWEDGDPQFFDVDCWEQLAENVAESVTKGQRVILQGTLKYRSWEAEDGSKRSAVSIRADHVGMSLQFSTCDGMTKNEKRSTSSSNKAPANSGGRGRDYEPDEDPF